MTNFAKLGLTAAFFAASAIAANAITITPVAADCDANIVDTANPDIATVACGGMGRNDATAVNLGNPDGNFYSLGMQTSGDQNAFGGSLILEIDPAFTGTAMIFEVTNPSNHFEAAEVYVTNSLSSAKGFSPLYVGTVDNGFGGQTTATSSVEIVGGPWKYLVLTDISHTLAGSGSEDGFDVDSIKLSAVPVPGAALLLGTALVGMGALRRRG